ncbi:hypothetical protein GCM10023194_15690 [Planotetraspora phitsanulokensis]|uniref:CU044_5270 family protein n=1 Tax=Planotetraspora phitsanulokensis TaxID=575192 RepID=A0A8J3UA75_9ACTN|nr:CU044_5270 family protein [Planotetraspora phitsanulokensis]GII38819.1 hypothetical protein Pph01_38220 [Planotetraspora phitsanulokensis]
MTDEFDMITQARPEAPAYSPAAKASARRRLTALTAEAPSRRRPFGIVIAGVAVVAGASVVVVNGLQPVPPQAPGQVAESTPGSKPGSGAVALPDVTNMSATEVLGRAAQAATDLNPRNDQFIKVTSQTMYPTLSPPAHMENGKTTKESRYLYRTNRTIWLSADGSKDGVLKIEYLKPRAYPGWPIPKEAYAEVGTTDSTKLPTCGQVPDTVYTRLKRLPTSEKGMRDYLYSGPHTKNPAEIDAWTRVGDLLRETYMPAAQRSALFKAAATISGVKVTGGVTDAAGRAGVGVGLVRFGVREDLVFDAKTFELLGERGTVVNHKEAKSPLDSVVSSTARLQVSVTDTAPKAPDPISEKKGKSCG